ncbi:MAG: NADH-quinone oxidoreductase subunit NuoN [Hyphomicrobiales bacterium]|nr:NADH-quinone oxidoreductase subunit NuoN [Hyphomicrobiales bacterium]
MTMAAFFASISAIHPELVLAIGAMALLMVGVFRKDGDANAEVVGWLSILLLIVVGWMVVAQTGPTTDLFGGAFRNDAFARFMKVLALGGAAVALLMSFDDMREGKYLRFEYPVLVLLATVGMMMMISANDLIALYLGLELQSLALYVVAAIRRDDVRSSEAGLKYFVLGALSSGMLLYGASLVYGFTGSTSFPAIAKVATSAYGAQNVGLIFGLAFVMVGLAFKVSAVPFHMWTPDVYQGAPTPVAAFFAAAPKVAAMALLMRFVLGAFPQMTPQWQQIVIFLALASMFLGSIAAIGQTNIKRLLAYSSIANVGFALIGLCAGTPKGAESVLVYMAIYIVMTLGAFACVLAMRRDGGPVEDIDELAGLSQTNLPLAAALAILMFSIAGIPPLAGFFAKFEVFLAAVNAKLWLLAVLGVIASVIGAYYYLRVVKIMFFDDAKPGFVRIPTRVFAVIAVAAALNVAYVVRPGLLIDTAAAAARSLFP